MRTLLLIAALGFSVSLSAPLRADEIRLQDNAPTRHVVVKGDTLWDISEKFLKDPWKWPEVWGFNKEQIKNPHWIYPGDVVLLTMDGGKPHLSLQNRQFSETVKLSPSIRGEPIIIKEAGIPAIPPKLIAPFLSRAGIVDPAYLNEAPRILGAVDERVLVMESDVVYASQGTGDTTNWNIVRPGAELIDPDTKETLGLETLHVGEARTLVPGNPMTLLITRGYMEIARDDKLVPALSAGSDSLVPHAPEKDISGKIISAYGGVVATAKYATIVINKGIKDGIEAGHVLAISRQGRELTKDEDVERYRYLDTKCLKPGKTITNDFYDPKDVFEDCKGNDAPSMLTTNNAWRYMDVGCLKPGAKISAFEFFNPKDVYKLHCRPGDGSVRLPDARVGLAFVYRAYKKVAYALVVQANGPVYLLDTVHKP